MKSIKIHDGTHKKITESKAENETIDEYLNRVMSETSSNNKLDYIDLNTQIIINMLNSMLNSADQTWNKDNIYNGKKHPFFYGALEDFKTTLHKKKLDKK